MRTLRPWFMLGFAAAAIAVLTPLLAEAGSKEEDSSSRPNILVIMTDQHSKYFLGCYGNRIVRTPSLDRLAAEGMRFTDTYCSAPLCVPSRMSFMTSRDPSVNRVWNNRCILGTVPTWAHTLSIAGYETSLIGRMDFKGPDQRHGFENRPIGEPGAGHLGVPNPCTVPGKKCLVYYHGGSGQKRSDVTRAGRGQNDLPILRRRAGGQGVRVSATTCQRATSPLCRRAGACAAPLPLHCPEETV